MKEIVIAFLIALSVGAILNGMNIKSQELGPDQGGNQTGFVGQELIMEADQSTFQGIVLDSKQPVLVEFYTDNCPICKQMNPVLGDLAYHGQGLISISKVNAENNQLLAERYDISNVPTFVLFNNGHMQDSSVGRMDKDQLRAWLTLNQIRVPSQSKSGSAEG